MLPQGRSVDCAHCAFSSEKIRAFEKIWGTLPRIIWEEAPEVTTEDAEVEISASVKAPQRVTHGRKIRIYEAGGGVNTYFGTERCEGVSYGDAPWVLSKLLS